MNPLKKYQLDLASASFQPDSSQQVAINALTVLHTQLMSKKPSKLSRLLNRPKFVSKGIYLWGDVGSGKTHLMNMFYSCLGIGVKTRYHFHHFMRSIHQQLKQLQGERDPLKKLAKQLCKQASVFCFDEFFVNDIADAMLLGRLFSALFAEGITLVATSNVKLDNLYQGGLQREKFLPAIELLKKNLQELRIGNGIDYRLEHHQPAEVYFFPLNEQTTEQMKHSFAHYMHGNHSAQLVLSLNEHCFEPIAYCVGVIWIDFNELCEKPRNAADYLTIARQFHTVLVSNIPILADKNLNAVLRFINLIDVFYDEQIRLVLSAATDIDSLYLGQKVAAEFKRTASRLYEMRDIHYLTKIIANSWLKNIA